MESFYDIGGDIDSESRVSSEKSAVDYHISYNDIANKLLNDKLLLTALELHSELVEAGRELPKLRDFFSNPGNFELQTRTDLTPCIPRSSSQVTLDSLDFTRYSEDGERASDDRVAVLEFELRKANEKINALRANLTVATECETPSSDGTDGSKSFLNDSIKPHEQRALNFLINEYLLMKGYKLTSITFSDQNEDQDFEDWDDVGLNIPKPSGLLQLYRLGLRNLSSNYETADCSVQTESPVIDEKIHSQLLEENTELKEELLKSHKEKLELVIDCEEKYEKDCVMVNVGTQSDSRRQSESNDKLIQTDELVDTPVVNLTKEALKEIEEAVNNLKNITFNSAFEKEIWKEMKLNDEWSGVNSISSEMLIQFLSPILIKIAQSQPLSDKQVFLEISQLLVCLFLLNPNPKDRDDLMQCLLNLKKRPQQEDRNIILSGLVRISRSQDSENIIESHLMPQCWDLMNNKYPEKRLLVVQICSQIALYIPSELRNSLLISILQQLMLEDKEEAVRIASVKSLSLIASFIDDPAKYSQVQEVTMKALNDASKKVVDCLVTTLLPVVAKWSLDLGKFSDILLPTIFSVIDKHLQAKEGKVIYSIKALMCLLPHLVMYTASSEVVFKTISSDLPPAQSRVGFGSLCVGLSSPMVFFTAKDDITVGSVMRAFDHCLKNKELWPQLEHLFQSVLPELLNLIEKVDPSQEEIVLAFVRLFRSLGAGFGTPITFRMKEMFDARLEEMEKKVTDFSKEPPSLVIVPVYVLGILTPLQVCNREEVGEALERFLIMFSVSHAPLECLAITFRETCKSSDLLEPLMAAIWKGVVHPQNEVKCYAAEGLFIVVPHCPEQVITSRVVPALITLASDPNLGVRVSTIPSFGLILKFTNNKEVLDKVCLQIQSIVGDPSISEDQQAMVKVISALGKTASYADTNYREEVILGSLSKFVEIASHLTELKKEVTESLVEAYSSTIYCQISPVTISHTLLPSLRLLITVCVDCLPTHVDTVVQMEKEIDSRSAPTTPMPRSSSSHLSGLNSSNVEEMKQKMTKIFSSPISKSTNLPNIPNLFKKK